MDINSFHPHAMPTAGVSISHDGLPTLASVHCYDRGNLATFGLQPSKAKPTKLPGNYPIGMSTARPLNPLLSHQRAHHAEAAKRPEMAQSNKVYSGAFYPPGSQPRLQFVDGRPILIPSTFENKFISRGAFDPTVHKAKSVVYNKTPPYSSCCAQYGSPENIQNPLCHDSPELVQRLVNDRNYQIRQNLLRRTGAQTPSAFKPPAAPVVNHSPTEKSRFPSNTTKSPILIDLDKIPDEETVVRQPVEVPRAVLSRNNGGESHPGKRHLQHTEPSVPKATTFRCNLCKKELTLESGHTYIDHSSTTSGFTSTSLCSACVKNNRLWNSMRNVATDTRKSGDYNKNENPNNVAFPSHEQNNYQRSPGRNGPSATKSSPVVIDLEEPAGGAQQTGDVNPRFRASSVGDTGLFTAASPRLPGETPGGGTSCAFCTTRMSGVPSGAHQFSEPCLRCVRMRRTTNKSIDTIRSERDEPRGRANENSTTPGRSKIVINLEKIPDGGENPGSDLYDSLELDIDEESFQDFLNMSQVEINFEEDVIAPSLTLNSNSPKYNGQDAGKLGRKRKSSHPIEDDDANSTQSEPMRIESSNVNDLSSPKSNLMGSVDLPGRPEDVSTNNVRQSEHASNIVCVNVPKPEPLIAHLSLREPKSEGFEYTSDITEVSRSKSETDRDTNNIINENKLETESAGKISCMKSPKSDCSENVATSINSTQLSRGLQEDNANSLQSPPTDHVDVKSQGAEIGPRDDVSLQKAKDSNEMSKSTSQKFQLNAEQLKKFRSRVVPALRAKKWISEGGTPNETRSSTCE